MGGGGVKRKTIGNLSPILRTRLLILYEQNKKLGQNERSYKDIIQRHHYALSVLSPGLSVKKCWAKG